MRQRAAEVKDPSQNAPHWRNEKNVLENVKDEERGNNEMDDQATENTKKKESGKMRVRSSSHRHDLLEDEEEGKSRPQVFLLCYIEEKLQSHNLNINKC